MAGATPRSGPPPRPAAGETHLWICDIDAQLGPGECAARVALLDDEETARWQRLRFPRDRDRFLASHAFLRSVLGLYAGREPAELRFAREGHGKPVLTGHAHVPAFNLSHSGGRALLAVAAPAVTLGVDIEQWRQGRRFAALARRNFSAVECAGIDASTGPARLAAFYRIWTLKEAYVKARGAGLSLRLDGFWFSFGPEGALALAAEPLVDPQPTRWFCCGWEPEAGFSAALVREVTPGVAPVAPRWFAGSPISGWREIDVPVRFGTRA